MRSIFTEAFSLKKIYIVLSVFAAANFVVTFRVLADRKFFNSSDFLAYSAGAKMLLDGHGKNLYDVNLQNIYWYKIHDTYGVDESFSYMLPYLAPPLTALLYVPYTLAPTTTNNIQYVVSVVINFFLFLVGAIILGKTTKKLVPTLIIVFSSWFVWVCVWQAQPTSLLFLITALLYRSLVDKNYKLAGFLCAFYIIKPQYLSIVPLVFLLTNKNLSFLKAFLAAFAVFVLFNLLISSPKTLLLDYPKFLIFTDNPEYGNRWSEMFSVQKFTYGLTSRVLDGIMIPILVGAIFYLWGAANISKLEKSTKNTGVVFAIIIVIALLSSYHVLMQDMALLSVFYALTTHSDFKNKLASILYYSLLLSTQLTAINYVTGVYTVGLFILLWSYSKSNVANVSKIRA